MSGARLKHVSNAPIGGTEFEDYMVHVDRYGLRGHGGPQDIYETSAIQRYAIGTRVTSPDGRVFRYAKSGAACYTGQGCAFYQDVAIAANCAFAVAATGKEISFATQTFAKNELAGGYITIYGGTPANADCPHRLIISNNACSAATLTLVLDGAVGRIVTAATFCEVYYNPYADLRLGTKTTESFAGVAATYVNAANLYFWVQTWGPCWIAPQVASFNSGEYRDAYFRHDGSIQAYSADQSDPYALNKQRAGFIMQTGLTAGPLLMLQVSP